MTKKLFFCQHRWASERCERCGLSRDALPAGRRGGAGAEALPEALSHTRRPRDLHPHELGSRGDVTVLSAFPDFDPWASSMLGRSIVEAPRPQQPDRDTT